MANNVPLAVLDVWHNGVWKMAGVLCDLRGTVPDGTRQGFIHSHKGNQFHRNSNSPCPVDQDALHWLRDAGLSVVYCYDEDNRIMRRQDVATLLAAPAFDYDGRVRHCLDVADWLTLDDVTMARAAHGGGRTYTHPERGLILAVPYVHPHVQCPRPQGF